MFPIRMKIDEGIFYFVSHHSRRSGDGVLKGFWQRLFKLFKQSLALSHFHGEIGDGVGSFG